MQEGGVRMGEGKRRMGAGNEYLMRILNRISSQSSGFIGSRFHYKSAIILTLHRSLSNGIGPTVQL